MKNTQTNVYIGIEAVNKPQNHKLSVYTPTSFALSCASGRISYLLGLKGASMSVNTACSSSLVCVDLAINSLKKQSM